MKACQPSPPQHHQHHQHDQYQQHEQYQQPSLQQQYSSHYEPAISDYFEQLDNDVESTGGPGSLSKREKLEMLFDGHKIKTPLDGFIFFLRFSIFILIISKLILITTFLIQGKLFDEINWKLVSSTLVSAFIATYFVLTILFMILIPLPDNRCGCHFFLGLFLVTLSNGELLLNQSNRYMKLTRGLNLICWSTNGFASLHLLCLAIKMVITCATCTRNRLRRPSHQV